jgi:sodium pump decarboxylase gamma subunit
MLAQGLTLLIAGMGTVVVFLWIMVLLMQAMAAFFRRFAHLFPEEETAASHISRIKADESLDIAIAIATVKKYTSQ